MEPEDGRAPFLRIPWTASLLHLPNTVCHIPTSRTPKPSLEDSAFAETLKTSRTLRSCVAVYQKPSDDDALVEAVSTLLELGDGVNGHPGVLHGGLVALVVDEAMGVLQSVNHERAHLRQVAKGLAHGKLPPNGYTSYTADLRIRYMKPVITPGVVVVNATHVKREGRKEWMHVEVRQRADALENDNGEEVVCATAEALFIRPRSSKM